MQARSKSLLVRLASPVPCLPTLAAWTHARVFEAPLIVVANRSYWQLDKGAIMLGGTHGPVRKMSMATMRKDDKHILRSIPHARTLCTLLGERRGLY